jgi:hypothetical protein
VNSPYSYSGGGSLTSTFYVNVLTKGAGYTAASGTLYPLYQPTLSIQVVPGGVMLWWPGWASGYQLQQNSVLSAAGWVDCPNPVNLVNGNNEVTITPANGTLFFRLMNSD